MRTDYLNQRALENIQPKCNAVELRICGHPVDILCPQRLPQEGLIIVEGNNFKNTFISKVHGDSNGDDASGTPR